MEVLTKSAEDTQKLGQEIGLSLKGGEILALVGDLGTGKTTFMQGLAKELGIKKQIISPTFILMRTYQISDEKNLYHLDLYRFEKNVDQELINLGITDIWERPENIVVIEWADKAKGFLPEKTKWIYFENISEDERRIKY